MGGEALAHTPKSFGESAKASVKNVGEAEKTSVKTFGVNPAPGERPRRLGRTAQRILDLVIADGSISQDRMAEKIGVSKRAVEMQVANLKAKGLIAREGADKGGYWRVIIPPQTSE